MSELNEQAMLSMLFALLVSVVLTFLAVCLLMVLHCFQARRRTKSKVYCGHCGNGISRDPNRAIAMGASGYLIYRCSACRKETALPNPMSE